MVYKAKNAVINGDVTFADGSSVWYNAVVRGDLAPICVGKNTNIQDGCVLHVEPGTPLVLGDGVTVGHGAVLHSCHVGDNSLIGMGAIVLNRVRIGKNCVIYGNTAAEDYPGGEIASGKSVIREGVIL